MKKVLFVCTGNTCRSCMAEAIGRRLVSDNRKYNFIEVSSAGLYAAPGEKASWQAVEIMKEYGIDLGCHTATQISKDIMASSDVILTMTRSHRDAVKRAVPAYKDRVFTLEEYASGTSGDISDPFGMPKETYRACAEELKNYIQKAFDRMLGEENKK